MYRYYRYRIYPNLEQRKKIGQIMGSVRFVWNKLLDKEIDAAKTTGRLVVPDPAGLIKEYSWLEESDQSAIYNVKFHLQDALRTAAGIKPFRFPRFKKKFSSRASYTTTSFYEPLKVSERSVTLPAVGTVKLKMHRPLPAGGKIRSVTVIRESNREYYASILIKLTTSTKRIPLRLKCVGLDFGMNGLFVDSEGKCADMPRYFKNSERRLAVLNKALSRRYKDDAEVQSRRYLKMKKRIARLYNKIKRQRDDYLHRLSRRLSYKYQVICIEDLDLVQMKSSKGMGKGVNDNAWAKFTGYLAYKTAEYDHKLIKVGRNFASSQRCSHCGKLNPAVKDLSVREWKCPYCGVMHDRDINAAVNIMNEGMRIFAGGT